MKIYGVENIKTKEIVAFYTDKQRAEDKKQDQEIYSFYNPHSIYGAMKYQVIEIN